MVKKYGLVVPVYKNFEGFAKLMASVDLPVMPYIIPNWDNNLGVSKGWNLGIARAIKDKIDTLFIIGDDVVMEPGSLVSMARGLASYDLVTAYNLRDHDRFIINGLGDMYEPEAPDFSCFAIDPVSFVSKVGWFDENFTPAYFEDNDMHWRMRVKGMTSALSKAAPMFHAGSVTQNWGGQQVVNGAMFDANREYYIMKWGGPPGEEQYKIPRNVEKAEEQGVGI